MYFIEVLQINSLVQLNEFHGCTNIVWGPFVALEVEQVCDQSSCSVVSGNNAATASVDDRLCGLVVRVSGYRYRGLGFDSRRYQIF